MAGLVASLRFFKTFLTSPKQIGAILPSGPALAKQITDPIDFDAAKVIVEFGPGTGSFTRVLLERKKKDTRLIAFEINEEMADFCATEFPDVELVRGSAENLVAFLAEQKITGIDAVVSGLPFANFPVPVQTKILEGVASSLKPGGLFLGFTYFHSSMVPATHRYRAKLKKMFAHVDRIPVMKNVPPAYVMRCKR
jgi:phosphatidylethanolamine/phosphatidyl-N-methylethanolamine N-methyltransferase